MFLPRARGHEYQVDHIDDRFIIRTNDQAKNFRLMVTPVAQPGREHWREIIPHRDDVYLGDFDLFKDFLVFEERARGLTQSASCPGPATGAHYLEFAEPAYRADLGANMEFDTKIVRFDYTSMKTPQSIYDYDMATRERKLLKQEEVLGGFNSGRLCDRADLCAEQATARKYRCRYSIAKVVKKDGRLSDAAVWLRLLWSEH